MGILLVVSYLTYVQYSLEVVVPPLMIFRRADLGGAIFILSSVGRNDDDSSGRSVRPFDLYILNLPRGKRRDSRWILVQSPFRSSLHRPRRLGINIVDPHPAYDERTNEGIDDAVDAERSDSSDGFRRAEEWKVIESFCDGRSSSQITPSSYSSRRIVVDSIRFGSGEEFATSSIEEFTDLNSGKEICRVLPGGGRVRRKEED